MSTKIKNIQLTDWDLFVLKYLYESYFLHRDHLMKFFPGADGKPRSYNAINVRIHKLKQAGLIKTEPCPISKGNVILGNRSAIKYLRYEEISNRILKLRRNKNYIPQEIPTYLYKRQPSLNLATYDHDYKVNELRFRMEDMGADYWIPEKIIRRKKLFDCTTPDGLFQKHNEVITIEMEKTPKPYYTDIFKQFAKENFNKIIYFYTHDRIKNVINRDLDPKKFDTLEGMQLGHKLYTINYYGFVNEKNMTAENYHGEKLNIREFLKS